MKCVAHLFVFFTAASALKLNDKWNSETDYLHDDANKKADNVAMYRMDRDDYVKEPRRTTFDDISDDEVASTDMHEDVLTAFNVTIMVYKDDQEFLSRMIKTHHAWETNSVRAICNEWIQAGAKGNLLDIGANLGTYSLPLAKCMQENGKRTGTLVAIEASPSTAQKLRASIRKNSFNNIHLYEYAIGMPIEDDSVTFDSPVANMGNNHMDGLNVPSNQARKGEVNKISIPLTTLDAITQQEGDVMTNVFAAKVDIEGAEMMAFQGGEHFLENGPCIIFIETKYNTKALYKLLEDKGYQARAKEGDNTWFHKKDMEQCLTRLQ